MKGGIQCRRMRNLTQKLRRHDDPYVIAAELATCGSQTINLFLCWGRDRSPKVAVPSVRLKPRAFAADHNNIQVNRLLSLLLGHGDGHFSFDGMGRCDAESGLHERL